MMKIAKLFLILVAIIIAALLILNKGTKIINIDCGTSIGAMVQATFLVLTIIDKKKNIFGERKK